MTIYMRSPLDLGALPLNGPRVPKSGWKMDLSADALPPRSRTYQSSHIPIRRQLRRAGLKDRRTTQRTARFR